MGFVGSDAEALEQLSRECGLQARRLRDRQRRVSAVLVAAPWTGRDADGFRQEWSRSHRPQLERVAAGLEAVAAALLKQASQQRQASRAEAARRDRRLDDPNALQKHRSSFGPFVWGGPESADYARVPLYSGGASGGASINSADVVQGRIGDCYLVAALAAMADTDSGRRAIDQAIRDTGDGTFTVTFADGEQVTVDDDFYIDGKGEEYYAHIADGAQAVLWAAVLEKAYAQKKGGFGDIEGGHPSEVFDALGLGGRNSTLDGISDAELLRILDSGQPVAFAASLDNPNGFEYEGGDGNHAFSVVETQVGASGEVYITMRNPWGTNRGLQLQDGRIALADDGTFVVTLAEARQIFYEVDYAGAS